MRTIRLVAQGLLFFIQIYYLIIFGRIIMSWFMMAGSGSKVMADIYQVFFALTEPLLAPLRRVIPSVRMGMGYLDLSPFILLILLRLAQTIIYRYMYF